MVHDEVEEKSKITDVAISAKKSYPTQQKASTASAASASPNKVGFIEAKGS